MRIRLTIIFICFFGQGSFAQNSPDYSNTGKGQMYILWGWNREAYTRSNLKLKGADYNLELKKVRAHDRPTRINAKDYLRVDRLTIPQTNFRIGYFIRKDLAITFGFDHMKYVMDNDQTVFLKGTIDRAGSYKGAYNGEKKITEDFLTFEHTDGLNYINADVEKYFKVYHSANGKIVVNALLGAGAGMLMPRTNVHLLNYEISDRFHISGFGLNMKAGMQAIFFKRLILKLENKNGYINMPNIALHKKGIPGYGKQSFFFTAVDGMIGYSFSFSKKKKNRK